MAHDVEAIVEVEFKEGRDEHSLKARKGWLGAGRTADGHTIFGEVMHGDLATDAGESLASFTMRCYRMDEYFKVDEVRDQGLALDFGTSRDMVVIEAEQVALALDSLPDPSREGVSLSGASLSDASVRRTRVSRPAETAAAVAQHREEAKSLVVTLPRRERVYHELRERVEGLVGKSVFSQGSDPRIPSDAKCHHRDTLKKIDIMRIGSSVEPELEREAWLDRNPDLPLREVERHNEINRRFPSELEGAKVIRYLDATLRKWDNQWPAQATPDQAFEVTSSLEQLLTDAQRQARGEQARQDLVRSMAEDAPSPSAGSAPELG